jgi:hypothetical protein
MAVEKSNKGDFSWQLRLFSVNLAPSIVRNTKLVMHFINLTIVPSSSVTLSQLSICPKHFWPACWDTDKHAIGTVTYTGPVGIGRS